MIRLIGFAYWLALGMLWATEPLGRLSSPAGHHKYIDPLVAAADFGIHY